MLAAYLLNPFSENWLTSTVRCTRLEFNKVLSMRFLVTNDDGVGAAGIELLAKVAAKFGEVTVVAPEFEQSGMSHKITFEPGLKIKRVESSELPAGTANIQQVFSVNGTPADCVRLAVATLPNDFDWVLSGVNDGANLGVDVFYSGTVAAAREAALLGLPAIAISQYRSKYAQPFDWTPQEQVVERLLKAYISGQKRSKPHWLNCNLPDPIDYPQNNPEFVECETDYHPLPNKYVESEDGLALAFKYQERPRYPGKDLDVCFGGNVAICRFEVANE